MRHVRSILHLIRGRDRRGPDAAGVLRAGHDRDWPRYHIIRVLGAGGMGVVYQAWDAELNDAVAVQVIRPEALGAALTATTPRLAVELTREEA